MFFSEHLEGHKEPDLKNDLIEGSIIHFGTFMKIHSQKGLSEITK